MMLDFMINQFLIIFYLLLYFHKFYIRSTGYHIQMSFRDIVYAPNVTFAFVRVYGVLSMYGAKLVKSQLYMRFK